MEDYNVVYDTVEAGVRMAKVELCGYMACVTYSPRIGGAVHVKIEQPDFFGPELDYVKGEFLLTYNYTVIPENFLDDFEAAYKTAREFCRSAGPVLERLAEAIRKGEPI